MKIYFILSLLAISTLSSCLFSINRTILFKTDGSVDNQLFLQNKADAERNYVISKFDRLSVELYTNKGEVITEPYGNLNLDISSPINITNPQQIYRDPNVVNPYMSNGNDINRQGIANVQNQNGIQGQGMNGMGNMGFGGAFGRPALKSYMVNDDGMVYLPLVGGMKVAGLKLVQADSLFAAAYSKYYVDVYAITSLSSRRVLVMGVTGNKMVTLPYESMHLLEVLTLADATFGQTSQNSRVKVIRNLASNKPIMQVIDLSTWDGVKNANMRIEPNDVIYVEPRKRIQLYTAEIQSVTGIIQTVAGVISSLASVYILYLVSKKP